ncbi:MAG: hypothetical protein U5P41_05620 [Gammaproteobacteria bacterium]|nr:hypothetical protein [Gammaproteobacteria bacterium]
MVAVRRVMQLAGLDAVVALAIVVALAVGAAAQTRLGEQLVVDLALLFQVDLGLEGIDFLGQIRGHSVF